MKKIFIILSLFLCACEDKTEIEARKEWDNIVKGWVNEEYEVCVNHATKEFENIPKADIEKTCKCAVHHIYISDEGPDDRFAIDFRAFLKEKCGKNIPNYTMRDYPVE